MVVDAVYSEPVSTENTLINPDLQGKFTRKQGNLA
jgi:hypothetical protein